MTQRPEQHIFHWRWDRLQFIYAAI